MATTWSTTDKDSSLVLSGGNLIVSASGSTGNAGIRATSSKSSGKYYLEFNNISFGNNNGMLGFAHAAQALNTLSMDSQGTFCINPAGTAFGNVGSFSMGSNIVPNVLGFAIDLTNGLMWARYNTGNWNDSGTADPVSGTGGVDIVVNGSNGAVFPFAAFQGDNSPTPTATLNLTGGFTGSQPSGFLLWDELPPFPYSQMRVIS